MKITFYVWTLIIVAVLTISCNQTDDKKKAIEPEIETVKVDQTVDTSHYFIKSILNSSPKEVAKKLGDPDGKIKPSADCDYLPNCNEATYQNDKYEVLYYNNKLKWIQINIPEEIFNEHAIEYIGFPHRVPTFTNEDGIYWRSPAHRGTAEGPMVQINGIREIDVFAPTSLNQYKGYILATVDANYKKKF